MKIKLSSQFDENVLYFNFKNQNWNWDSLKVNIFLNNFEVF